MTSSPPGFSELEFDLPAALLDRLVAVFDGMQAAPLSGETLIQIPDEQGVYLLLHRGKIAYVGKTDGEAGLRARLARHSKRVQHRSNLNPADVSFKAIRIFVFTVVDLETQLIKKFHGAEWNNSGFGSNDPGRERDTTKLKEDGFDAQFPIDIDLALDVSLPSTTSTAAAILTTLKSYLPYVLRIGQNSELKTVSVPPYQGPLTTRAILVELFNKLPSGWQATALAGRVIMYKEN